MQYFEDLVPGSRFEGEQRYQVTAEAVREFCSQWDPMPFHLDEAAAKATPVGRLFTSSIHTFAVGSQLSHQMGGEPLAVMAGLGWDDVRFPKPVCPGDTLRVAVSIADKRESRSKPDRGIATMQAEIYNQHDDMVMSYKVVQLVAKRPPA